MFSAFFFKCVSYPLLFEKGQCLTCVKQRENDDPETQTFCRYPSYLSTDVTVYGSFHYENMPIQIYSNILKFLPPKNENFQMKNSENFHISARNIDCWYSLEPPRRGGSNEYPQSMFLSRNKKKIMYTPVNSSFTI